MKRPRTIDELQNSLDDDFGWRLQEIHEIKSSIKSSSAIRQQALIRAGVPVVYAHWEGFIKESARRYLTFINNQRLYYRQVKSCFLALGLGKHLGTLADTRKAELGTKAVESLLESLNEHVSVNVEYAVNTKSNLNWEIFRDILASLGIDRTRYETRANFLDERLVRSRNEIAHGQNLGLASEDFETLAGDTIGLMREFKTDIENAATQSEYRVTEV